MSISNLHHVSFHPEIEQFNIFYINGKQIFLFMCFILVPTVKFLCVPNERTLGYPYTKVHGVRNIRK